MNSSWTKEEPAVSVALMNLTEWLQSSVTEFLHNSASAVVCGFQNFISEKGSSRDQLEKSM
jgi:hypothetical protein